VAAREDVNMCPRNLYSSLECCVFLSDSRYQITPWLGTSPLGKSHPNSYNYFWVNQCKILMLYYSSYKIETILMACCVKSQNSENENGPLWTEIENYFKISLACTLFMLQRSYSLTSVVVTFGSRKRSYSFHNVYLIKIILFIKWNQNSNGWGFFSIF